MTAPEILATVSLGVNAFTFLGVIVTKFSDIKYLKDGHKETKEILKSLPCMIPHCPIVDNGMGNGKDKKSGTRAS